MLKFTVCVNRLRISWTPPSVWLAYASEIFLIICLMTHIACLSRAKERKSWATSSMKWEVRVMGKSEMIFWRKWVAFGCWAKVKKEVLMESITSLYSSSVVNKVIRVWSEWVPCLFLAIPGMSAWSLCTIRSLWASEHTPISFWII